MALPTNVDLVSVSGTFLNSDDGSPCVGTVSFTPAPCWWADVDDDMTIIATPVEAVLDAQGGFIVNLIATDSDALNPSDWTYTVRVRLADCGVAYSFEMAAPMGATIDLSDVTPVFASAGNAVIVGPQGPPGFGVNILGTLSGTATALPAEPAVGDMWVLGSPVPAAAPHRADGSPAQTNDGIVYTAQDGWIDTGPIQGPEGMAGPWTKMTQAEFEALDPKDPNTLYVIIG